MKIIYKITNLVNGKIYIGKTTQSIEKRFKEHCIEASRYQKCLDNKIDFGYESNLYPAMIKYGYDNFNIEIVESFSTEINLNDKEIYYIEKFQSQNPEIGYNISRGGLGGPLFKGHHHKQDTKLKLGSMQKGKKWYNNGIVEIMVFKDSTVPEGFIKGRLEGKGFKKGKDNPSYGKPGYNKGKHMTADTKNKLSQTKKLRNKDKNLVWFNNGITEHEFDLNKDIIPDGFTKGRILKKTKAWRAVEMYTLDNTLIATFDSLSQAEKATNISVGSILACCSGRTKKAGKYIWRYKEDTKTNNYEGQGE